MGPKSTAGSLVTFQRADGVKVSVPIPAGAQAGDMFDVSPPAVMVRVPDGCKPHDFVVFQNCVGRGQGHLEETEWCRAQVPSHVSAGEYFPVRLPLPPTLGSDIIQISCVATFTDGVRGQQEL